MKPLSQEQIIEDLGTNWTIHINEQRFYDIQKWLNETQEQLFNVKEYYAWDFI